MKLPTAEEVQQAVDGVEDHGVCWKAYRCAKCKSRLAILRAVAEAWRNGVEGVYYRVERDEGRLGFSETDEPPMGGDIGRARLLLEQPDA